MSMRPLYIALALLALGAAASIATRALPYGGAGDVVLAEATSTPPLPATSSVDEAPPVPEAPRPGEDEIGGSEHHEAEKGRDTEVPIAKSGGLVRLSHLSAEWMPDLAGKTTKTITKSGRWSAIASDMSIAAGDVVRIPKGVDVVYDAASSPRLEAVVVEGSLSFDSSKRTRLDLGTLLVSGGELSIKPGRGGSAEIAIYGSVDPDDDPAQVLVGFVATGGKVDIRGEERPTPFVRASGKKGSSAVTLASPPGWRVGDEIFLSASSSGGEDPTYWWFTHRDPTLRKPFPEEWETARIASIDGSSAVLDRALSYDHDGYAAVLDRSVTIRTDPASPSRGHFMAAGNTELSVVGARIKDFGRTTVRPIGDAAFSEKGEVLRRATNQQGRYALHAHHVVPEFLFEGNVIDGSPTARFGGERGILGSPRWGIVNHDSHGSIRGNVVIGAAGSGIVGEDATETGVVEGNLVAGTGGGSGEGDDDRFGSSRGEDMAHGGFGYWFRGPFLEVRDNVAVGHFPQTAYLYFVHPDFIRNSIPDRSWIPSGLRGKSQIDLASRNPIREFSGNSASGFFGNAAFMVLYSNVPNQISGLSVDVLGGEDVRGIFTRHSGSLVVSDSTLRGAGGGTATLASESDPIRLERTTVSGFDK